MTTTPRERALDSTLALLADPYGFVPARCRSHASDVFEARILMRRTLCMTGREAARIFYDPQRFARSGAMPRRIFRPLFGRGTVHGLDDAAHRHRKQLFMSMMTRERIDDLCAISARWWRSFGARWAAREVVVLYPELQELYCRSVCEWAGVPLPESDVQRRTRDLAAMFGGAAGIGVRHRHAIAARRRTERWLGRFVRDVRRRLWHPPRETAAYAIAWHRDHRGELLTSRIAAVELTNVLRPVVAVSLYATFAALALHEHPGERRRLEQADDAAVHCFVQEVRRFYPFIPVMAAVVRHDFHWAGHAFPRGRRVLLDLYGTDRDPRLWDDPDRFLPSRFETREIGPFDLLAQGGGDHWRDHRCAGEWITIGLMTVAVDVLVHGLQWDVPTQDLALDTSRVPAVPRSGLEIRNVRDRPAPVRDTIAPGVADEANVPSELHVQHELHVQKELSVPNE